MKLIFCRGFIFFLGISVLFSASSRSIGVEPGQGPRRIKVLFLGDRGLHQPRERARQVYSPLGRHGIDLTYTENVGDLNPTTLARYDVVLLYANIERIAPDQEKALLDYVENGGGFVPVHCGSFCFLNSPKITAMTGARFKSHGTGTFKETIVKSDHELMKDLKPIESWDESYVHTMHNEKDRTVLSVREDDKGKEPYTWVRTQGKGRVFYTAWGHDQRTWGNEDFQKLLERGIRWAAGDWGLKADPLAGLKTPEYFEADMPNYPAGRQWGVTDANNRRPVQKPMSVEDSMKRLVIPPGFEVSLFASEPDIKKPICMAWDERGRLWIAETVDYPNDMQSAGNGHDRITICEDTDGDGKADKFTVFADKLSIPTSFCFANGGVVVAQAPNMLFLKDTDGDDKADVRTVLFSGWGTGDTHAGPSNLRYGFDNWIYGMVGYSGFRGQVGGQNVRLSQSIFRMKPDGSALENLGNVTNNTWGIGWTEDGHLLASTANRDPSFYLHIPNRYYEQVHGWTVKRLEVIADNPRIFPITDKVRQVDQHGLITACAGHALYTARSFPQEYWNRIAFLNEPTGHVISKYIVERNGTGFKTVNDFNMLASTDEWTAPISSEVGPDGSLWVIDWYNIIVQHNPIPRGFQGGKGGAYATPLRDKTHGRIYRLTWKGSTPSNTKSLAGASADQLVAALKSDNMLWRMHAQRLLVEHGDKSVLPKLIELVKDKSIDAVGLNTAAIHALWTMHGLGLLDGSNAEANAADEEALAHPSAGVRKAAVEVMTRDDSRVELLGKMLADPDAQVRKSALLALADLPASDKAGGVIFASLKAAQDDRWLEDAASIAAAKHDSGFLKAAFAAYPANDNTRSLSPVERKIFEAVLSSYAQGTPAASVASVLAAARNADASLAGTVIKILADVWPVDMKPTLSEADAQALRDWLPKLSAESKDHLLVLSQRWGRKDLFGDVYAQAVKEFGATLVDTNADASRRAEAARRLITLDDSAATVELVLKQVEARSAPDVQIGLLSAVAESRSPDAGRLLVAQWSKLTPKAQQTVLNLVLRRAAWTRAFVYALQESKVNARDLQPQHWQALMTNPDRFVSGAARRLQQQAVGGSGNITASRKEIVEKFTPLASKKGDAAQGKAVFTKNCAVCHTIDGQGGQVGPNLTGIGARGKADLIIEIMDPNRSVEGTYRQWIARTKDDVISGRLLSESNTSIELIDAAGQKHALSRDSLESLTASNLSVMPEGFEQLPEQDIVDLLEFLATSNVKH